jgi:Fe-S-cluster formation regulator IscX/YfhJ
LDSRQGVAARAVFDRWATIADPRTHRFLQLVPFLLEMGRFELQR